MKTVDYQKGYIIGIDMTEQELRAFRKEWKHCLKNNIPYVGEVLVLRMPPNTAWSRIIEGLANFARRVVSYFKGKSPA